MKVMQGFGQSPSTQAWEKTVDTWNHTMQKFLDGQVEGARLWAENITKAKGTEDTAEWTKQGQDLIARFTETQKQLWGNWFELIKKLDASNMMNWPRDGQKFVQTWQETIQKAFNTQTEWLRTTAQARNKS
jgi:hypothetical protein